MELLCFTSRSRRSEILFPFASGCLVSCVFPYALVRRVTSSLHSLKSSTPTRSSVAEISASSRVYDRIIFRQEHTGRNHRKSICALVGIVRNPGEKIVVDRQNEGGPGSRELRKIASCGPTGPAPRRNLGLLRGAGLGCSGCLMLGVRV